MKNYLNKNVIKHIEKEYGVEITYCSEEMHGKVEDKAFSTYGEIYLGKYSNEKIEALCLFHELGHIVSNRNKSNKTYICTLSQECIAWETAIELLIKHKDIFNFDLDNYYGEELTFMRKCLKSYFDSEYNELIRMHKQG